MEYIYERTNTIPSVILGDFNSLTRKDYSTDEWNNISKIRKINMWELPVGNATEMMTIKYNWRDTRNMAKNVKGDLYTCRFNTRIDYIYINDLIKKWWKICECNHINAIPNISDHNLVVVTLDL
jgi:exonuclease III